jgi:hypothetical protein
MLRRMPELVKPLDGPAVSYKGGLVGIEGGIERSDASVIRSANRSGPRLVAMRRWFSSNVKLAAARVRRVMTWRILSGHALSASRPRP